MSTMFFSPVIQWWAFGLFPQVFFFFLSNPLNVSFALQLKRFLKNSLISMFYLNLQETFKVGRGHWPHFTDIETEIQKSYRLAVNTRYSYLRPGLGLQLEHSLLVQQLCILGTCGKACICRVVNINECGLLLL